MRLRQLVENMNERPGLVRGSLDVDVGSLVADSRRAGTGSFFFALPGTHVDGAAYIGEAVGRGALAVGVSADVPEEAAPETVTLVRWPRIARALAEVADRFYGKPSEDLVLVGVTGTNGKTTVSFLLESIWRSAGLVPGVIGTVSYRIAGEARPAALTTPQPIELQALLGEMRSRNVTHVVMEVSSHALALERVRHCRFDGAVFTNLTRDHLDFHRDLEDYFEAKARLFGEVLPEFGKPDSFAVVHRDDPFGARLLERVHGRVVTFGQTTEADVRPLRIESTVTGLRGRIAAGADVLEIESGLVGDPHLENVLAAVAVAHAQGLDTGAIEEGIRNCPVVPGRMERVASDVPFTVLVDYAHTPDALNRAARVLRDLTEKRLIVVFGCGGDRDRGKRPLMGEAVARIADLVVLTSDNPRTEDPLAILEDIEPGVRRAGLPVVGEEDVKGGARRGYLIEADRARAIRLAIEVARTGDVVLIAGKGHETYQIVGTERRDFDDRKQARTCLGRLEARA